MLSSKSSIFLCVLASRAIFAQTAAGFNLSKLLVYACFVENSFYAKGSEYEENSNAVLNALVNATPTNGFDFAAAPPHDPQVYGMAFCRGDISKGDCGECVASAAKQAQEACSFQKNALAWLEGCVLKYSDTNFYGRVNKTAFYFPPPANASIFASRKMVRTFFRRLSAEASASPALFAKDAVNIWAAISLYDLVQCSRDLSPADCKSCLRKLTHLAFRLYAKSDTLYLTQTCTLEYEFYPFFNA